MNQISLLSLLAYFRKLHWLNYIISYKFETLLLSGHIVEAEFFFSFSRINDGEAGEADDGSDGSLLTASEDDLDFDQDWQLSYNALRGYFACRIVLLSPKAKGPCRY